MKMLRTARKKAGLTMKELATRIGVSESAISQYENGRREADFETVIKISDVLNCSIDYLIRGTEKISPSNKEGYSVEHLRKLRISKGLSQQAVANYLEITRQAYSNYENGNREPDFETLLKMGEFFGVSIEVILRGNSEEKPTAQDGEPSIASRRSVKMDTFYDRFVQLCAEHKVSPTNVAKAVGLSNAAATGWKNGKIPYAVTVEKLAKFFGVSKEWLLGEEEKPTAQDGELTVPAKAVICQSHEEEVLLRKFRCLDDRGRSAVLNILDHEYNSLPGNQAAPPAKNA